MTDTGRKEVLGAGSSAGMRCSANNKRGIRGKENSLNKNLAVLLEGRVIENDSKV